MNESNKQLKFGAILSYFSIALNIIAGLLYTPWMIKMIGQNQYGIYTLASSLIALFLVDFGLSSATARYVANYRARGEEQKINDFLGIVYKLYIIIDAIIFLILLCIFFFIGKIYVKLTPDELEKFKVVYCIAAMYSVISFPFVTLNGIMTAYEKFIQLKLSEVIYRVLLVTSTVIALLNGQGLYTLVLINSGAGLAVIVYKYLVIKRTTSIKVNFKSRQKSIVIDIFSYSIWITIMSLTQRLVFNITPTILGIVSSTASIAVFGVITTIEGYSYTISTAINGMFMPKISRIYANGDNSEELMSLMVPVGRFQYSLCCLIIVGWVVAGKDFIQVWLGSDYSSAYIGIFLVIMPSAFSYALQVANTALMVKNEIREQALVYVITGIVNLGLSFITSAYFGVIGACIAICVAYFLRTVIMFFIYKKKLKINIGVFFKSCYLKSLPTIIISVGIGILLRETIVLSGWIKVVVLSASVVFIYCVCVWFMQLTKNERSAIIKSLRNR